MSLAKTHVLLSTQTPTRQMICTRDENDTLTFDCNILIALPAWASTYAIIIRFILKVGSIEIHAYLPTVLCLAFSFVLLISYQEA